MLRSLGNKEVESIINKQKLIEVACEFSNQNYEFDAIDPK